MSKINEINYSREAFETNWNNLNTQAKKLLGPSYQVIALHTIEHNLNELLGNILTIVDAGYGEMEKTKFCKDLLRQAIWDKSAEIRRTHFGQAPFIQTVKFPPIGDGIVKGTKLS